MDSVRYSLVMLVIVWLMEGMRQRKLVQGEIGWAWIAILPFMGSYLIEITTSPRPIGWSGRSSRPREVYSSLF